MLVATACAAFLLGLVLGVLRPEDEPPRVAIAAGLLGLGGWVAGRARARRAAATETRPATATATATPTAPGIAPRPWPRLIGLLALFGLGLSWASLRQPPRTEPVAELLAGATRTALEATVVTPPTSVGATTHVGLELNGGARLTLVDWRAGLAAQLSVGDRVHVAGGKLTRSSRGDELAFPEVTRVASSSGSSTDPRQQLATLRAAAVERIHQQIPEPQAALSAGLLLGGTTNLDPDLRLLLQRSGLSHLLAVDGYKQVLVAGALQVVARRLLGRWLAVPVSLLGILGYTLLTGASASAVRAGLMLALSLLAGLVGRLHDPLTGLLLAATAMATLRPTLVLELAFQLSVAATLGLVLLYPRLRRVLRGVPRPLAEPAGLTLAVTLATLPVTLVAFQQVSIVSPLAHVVAGPLVPLVLLAAALLVVLPPLPGLASLAAMPTTLLIDVVHVFGSLPGAAISTGHLPPLGAAALAGLLVGWGVWELPELRPARRGLRARLASLAWLPVVRRPLGIAVAAALSGWLVLLLRPDGRLHVAPLPLQRGAAWLVRGPAGATALVVQGPADARELADDVRGALAVWESRLDLALVIDPADWSRLDRVLGQYPARELADGASQARFDLGHGAVLDTPDARVSYGAIDLPLTNQTRELETDGRALWLR